MKFVCWQPMLTDHQAYTYAALREGSASLTVNIWRQRDALRESHGWIRTDTAMLDEHAIPRRGWLRWVRRALADTPDAIHVFGSPFEDRRQIATLMLACAMRRRVAIIAEPYSISAAAYFDAKVRLRDRVKRTLRPWLYRGYGALIARRLDVVFAISPLACDQYHAIGVPAARIAPFGYFVPPPAADPAPQRLADDMLRLVFLGSLIARKGLATAIEAVSIARRAGHAVTLDVYGPGDPSGFAFGDGIVHRGVAPFGQAAGVLRKHDALVLPSLFDGWGVVVNEAIQAGIPVIASDAVGASAIVRTHRCGAVFATGDADALAALVARFAQDRATLADAARAADSIAPSLAPEIAARYMLAAFDGVSMSAPLPPCPWYVA